ncbi:MAG TPA: 6-hydroxymethylpterin diphosphokinase MptE-like protein [Methylomirabilota bacterium]|nr:6-hydroxymethylpterin diphosphokinase MptE-like protein [Methylomirabilota bacterium]
MELGRRIASGLEAATFDRIAAIGLANAEVNRPRIGRSVLELQASRLGMGEDAIVVGAGPSLARRRSLERLHAAGYAGTIVASDGALGACLRAGVVPHVVVTVDPHPDRIVRWFGDPRLTAPSADDYFRRQEMDPVHRQDEVGANRALVELVDAFGPKIRVAAATSAAPAVVARCEQAGMELYWWNPMFDDYERPDSLSRRLWEQNRLPCLNGGGNVGTAAWVVAHAVLGKTRIGLIGMDFSYPPGASYEKTQYYPELVAMLGDRFADAYTHVANPHIGETWFCDPAYIWFRDVFLGMAGEADCETVNCTEGGILFGEGIAFTALDEFLTRGGGGR